MGQSRHDWSRHAYSHNNEPNSSFRRREYGLFEVISHPIGRPELSETVVPAATVNVAMGSVATFRLINAEPNRRHECRRTHRRRVAFLDKTTCSRR